MRKKQQLPWLPLLIACFAFPAVFMAARAAGPTSPTIDTMATYTEILSLIEDLHVPVPDSKKVIYSGIHGMMQTLDPHTNFLDDATYREMREEQRGSFFGLGIVISKRGRYQPLRVVSPIANTPADRLGIRAGDIITHISDARADVDIDTFGLTIQESVKYLRGPRNTPVEITVDRPGRTTPLVFTVMRDAVRTPAVTLAFNPEPGTGYIRLANFTETTSTELDEALNKLKATGTERLILDLRQNPGGLLEQAQGVASRFLTPNELIVYTEGRLAGSRQDLNALRDVPHIEWPVVVLIDRGSASASEIVAGAIQDHDRGIVVGETSFGKGLVQSVYPLSENTALALTTQKYYTPAGRSIQRPYQSQEDYYLEVRRRDSDSKPNVPADAPEFTTMTGRSVYGGGGIMPDISVPLELAPSIVAELNRDSAFAQFITPLDEAGHAAYEKDHEALVEDFLDFAGKGRNEEGIKALEAAREDILLQLRGELALARGGMTERDRVFVEASEVLAKAIEALPKAQELLVVRKAALEARSKKEERPSSRRPG